MYTAACTYAYISKMYTIFNTFYYYLISLRQLLLVLLSTILPDGDSSHLGVVRFFSYSSFLRTSFGATSKSVTYRRLASRGLICVRVRVA